VVHDIVMYIVLTSQQSEITIIQSDDNQPKQDDEKSQVENGLFRTIIMYTVWWVIFLWKMVMDKSLAIKIHWEKFSYEEHLATSYVLVKNSRIKCHR